MEFASEPAHTLYDASKGAVNALTRQLAIELAPNGFTTVAVAPGFVETPLTDMGLRSDPAARRTIEEQIPIRRIATVEDLAAWTPAYTANRPVNAIPFVCAAPPGILLTTDLPPITPGGPSKR